MSSPASVAPPSATPPPAPAAPGERRARPPRPSHPRRPLGPRASMPGSRAIVGGLLIALAAVGTYTAHASATSGPTQRYAVARRGVLAGHRLTPDDVDLVAVDLPDDLAAHTFTIDGDLDGAIALAPIAAGDLVQRSAVQPPDRGEPADAFVHELSFALEQEHALGGAIERGERIDLVATYGTGPDAYTTVVARRVLVIDVDRGARSTLGAAGRVTITVALDDEAAVLGAAHALEIAKVTVARSTRADADAPAGPARYPAPDAPVDATGAPSAPATPSHGAPIAPVPRAAPTTTTAPAPPSTEPTTTSSPDAAAAPGADALAGGAP